MSSSNTITSPTLSASGGTASSVSASASNVSVSNVSASASNVSATSSGATSSTPTPAQPTGSGTNPFGGNNDNNNNNNANGGSTPLSVFMTPRHFKRQTSGDSSVSAQPSSNMSSSASSTSTSTSPTGTSSSNDSGNGGGGSSGLWSPGTNFPVPFLAFAVVAIALFVVVVAFVLLRICMRNRRLRRMGILPDGPFDRFLGGGNMGHREIEDTQVPPRLWEAKIVPISAYAQDTHYRSETGQRQDSFSLWGGKTNNEKAPAAPGAPSLPQGWANLMPIAASLPSNLYSATGAQKMLSALEDGKKESDPDAADQTERIPGSVNVSVFIAMPSPPKQDGEELPELMIGTAAVPIFSRPATANVAASTPATAAPNGEYFGEQRDATPPATANKQFSHPTRAELLALYRLAREVKGAKASKRQEAATNAAATAATPTTEEDTGAGETTAVHPSTNDAPRTNL